jgi:hypothetical protein
MAAPFGRDRIPASLSQPGAVAFWLAIALTGIGTGVSAAVLTKVLELVQRLAWPGDASVLVAATRSGPWQHLLVLMGAGVLTGIGQLLLALPDAPTYHIPAYVNSTSITG